MLKGCEAAPVNTASRYRCGTSARSLQACLAIDLVVAWRVMDLAKRGRETPNIPCTVFFEEAEWQALACYHQRSPIPPQTPPTLGEAMRLVARLGGFLGRNGAWPATGRRASVSRDCCW